MPPGPEDSQPPYPAPPGEDLLRLSPKPFILWEKYCINIKGYSIDIMFNIPERAQPEPAAAKAPADLESPITTSKKRRTDARRGCQRNHC
jgi:hypothetical protein